MRTLSLLPFFLMACGPNNPLTDDTDGAIPADPASFGTLSATLSEAIPAVVVVNFEVEGGAGEPWVRFGPADEDTRYQTTADEQDDGSWQAILVGCPAQTICSYAPGRGEAQGDSGEIATGTAPDWVEIQGEPTGDQSAGFLLTTVMSSERAALILDLQGRLVWWYPVPDLDGGGLTTRASLAPDGRSVWFNQFDLGSSEPVDQRQARLVQVALDGSWHEILTIPDTHHDFHLSDDGSVVWLGLEEREVEGEPLQGDRLVRRDATGEEEVLWSGWDSFTYDPESQRNSPPGYWTLANHLEQDSAVGDDAWAIGFKNLDTIIGIDGVSGDERWRLGKEEPAIDPDTPFAGQHGFTLLDDSILLFDNQGAPGVSRVLELTLDTSATSSDTLWEHDNGSRTLILGDVLRTESGRTMIAWGEAGIIEEIAVDGTIVTDIRFTRDEFIPPIGFLEYQESIGPR